MNPYFKEGNDPFPLTYAIKDKSQYGYPVRERFTAIDPAGDETLLRFKPIHKNEIETVFCSLDTGLNMYLKLDQPNNHILLNNNSDRVYADVHAEVLIAALRRLSSYMEDVRFLMLQEQSSYIDEIIIQNGLLYAYRHDLDDDFIETRYYYFENIAYRYKDVMIGAWLTKEYFAQGKRALKYGEIEEAVNYLKKAAAKRTGNFEIYHELGMLLLTKTNEYKDCIKYLSKALGVFKYAEIFLHRALAYCKIGEVTNANKDIQQYIRSLENHEISKLVSGGFLFSKEGYNTEAHTLFSAALAQCLLSESKRIEKRNAATSDQEKAFYDEGLARDAELKSRIYTGLNALK